MGSEWITYSVDEIATVKSGKRLPKDESLTDKKTSYPYIRLVDVNQGKIDASKIQYLEPKTQNKISRYIVEANDVCLAIVGHTIGMVFYVEDEWNKANLTENAARLTDISSSFNPRYIYYYLISPVGRSEIVSRKVGSAQGKLPLYNIKELKIKAPDRITQDHIVDVLLSLDNKITLNRQINQTLEQMAQTLFKSWFVDFDPVIDNALDAGFFEQDLAFSDELLRRVEARKAVRERDNFKPLPEDIRQLFPNAFNECAEAALGLGGWLPKGWRYDCVGELLSSTIGGDWGKDEQDEKHTVQSRIIRGTDIPDLSNGQLSDAPLRWVEPKKLKSRQIEVGDIIIEVSGGSPTQSTGRSLFITQLMLERLGGVVEPASFCRRFEPKSYSLGMLASIHLKKIYSDGKMWEYQNQSTGIANFQTKFFLDAEQVLIPSDEVLDKFTKTVRPFIEKSQNNEQIELTKLRDTLLPKLISGELSLNDIKIDIPEETPI
ncbi:MULTISPECIES: restriction endonuclease subunit S [Providencia]|uniref:restriction endonuclease subunit S n=1 Tax=Providencia TaxID=586 RepID=UPI0008396783|nr:MULTISPECIES: restriction endonuclease subunit S [Providencia]MBP6122804.1 restriction endonuclease subunit S [Providencia sp.]NIH22103.1 restriction endonuclease subunit S [Providencia heimbachae]